MSEVGNRLNDLLQMANHIDPHLTEPGTQKGYWVHKHGVRIFIPANELLLLSNEDWSEFKHWWLAEGNTP